MQARRYHPPSLRSWVDGEQLRSGGKACALWALTEEMPARLVSGYRWDVSTLYKPIRPSTAYAIIIEQVVMCSNSDYALQDNDLHVQSKALTAVRQKGPRRAPRIIASKALRTSLPANLPLNLLEHLEKQLRALCSTLLSQALIGVSQAVGPCTHNMQER